MNTTLKSFELRGKKYKSVLIISDQHFPYQHQDLIPFLKELDNSEKFDLIVNSGDEVDKQGLSYHEKEPELPSYSDELDDAIEALQPVYKLFPKMYILDSNHGSLILRKGKSAGIPSRLFKTPREVLRAPKGWQWCRDITFQTDLGPVYGTHGKTSAAGKLSKNMAMNTFQGHYHSKFQITYWGSPVGLFWDMHVGCVVNDSSLAMAYNKITLDRPIIGVATIKDGRPNLRPMVLNKYGRWVGKL